MKQMEMIIKILLEGIHITLKMMMSNLIWHILIKCPELEITAKYTHDAILSAGNAQIYYHRKTGIFLYFPKQMFWVLKWFVLIYYSRRPKLSLLTWMEVVSLENYGLLALKLGGHSQMARSWKHEAHLRWLNIALIKSCSPHAHSANHNNNMWQNICNGEKMYSWGPWSSPGIIEVAF